eukprot:scaffold1175_cov248-Pinguiococcus_pyrenoidosus.AAC.12
MSAQKLEVVTYGASCVDADDNSHENKERPASLSAHAHQSSYAGAEDQWTWICLPQHRPVQRNRSCSEPDARQRRTANDLTLVQNVPVGQRASAGQLFAAGRPVYRILGDFPPWQHLQAGEDSTRNERMRCFLGTQRRSEQNEADEACTRSNHAATEDCGYECGMPTLPHGSPQHKAVQCRIVAAKSDQERRLPQRAMHSVSSITAITEGKVMPRKQADGLPNLNQTAEHATAC